MRGRGRNNWRSGAVSEQNNGNNYAQQSFVPPMNNPTPEDEYYQQNLPADTNNQGLHDSGIDGGNMQENAMDDGEGIGCDNDDPMQDGDQQAASETHKRPWEKFGGVKAKKKKAPGAKNIKIRRYVQPKNAVMCLNELCPGVIYAVEQEGSTCRPFCISVQIDGQKYRGYGSSKQLAKQAAAEAALISFVKPPVTTTEGNEDDKTPWAALASFAIYKLFSDWREGRVGMCPPGQPYGSSIPPGFEAFFNQSPGSSTVTMKEEPAQPVALSEALTAHLGGFPPTSIANNKVIEGVKVHNPAKQIPENAASMHPVMVLHQMKPGVTYDVSQSQRDNKPFFTITTEIDGQQFTGEGSNVKKAKFFLAKAAILGLYNIDSTFENPA